MSQQLEITDCDGCPLKTDALTDAGRDTWYCNYGTVDTHAKAIPSDCTVRDGGVLVKVKVYR